MHVRRLQRKKRKAEEAHLLSDAQGVHVRRLQGKKRTLNIRKEKVYAGRALYMLFFLPKNAAFLIFARIDHI